MEADIIQLGPGGGMVDTKVSKTFECKLMWVRLPLWPHAKKKTARYWSCWGKRLG